MVNTNVMKKREHTYVSLEDKENLAYVNDIGLATTLVSNGFEVFSIDRVRSQATFIFERDELLDETIQAYWSDRVSVHPLSFMNTLKNLKARIYHS